MPNQQSINSFIKGMNKDLDISVLQKDVYLDAKNFRVITKEGSSSTALEVVDGNVIQSNVSISNGYSIIGYGIVRDKIILFTTNNTNSIIYVADVINGVFTNFKILYDDSLSPDGTTFSFSTSYPIKALGRYETETIQKIYWTDNYNNLRFINIADINIQTYSINKFEIIPPIIESSFSNIVIGSGSIKAGKVQYAYQLYNINGSESAFIKMSDFVALSNSTLNGNDSQFRGTKEGGESGKSVTFTLSNLDTSFDRIRIVRLLYTNLNGLPIITIINESTIVSTITFTDNGSKNLGELTLEEFLFINYDFKCNDIETKNNILFTSNITENNWDPDYDARAFRFSSKYSTGTISGTKTVLYSTSALTGTYNTYTPSQVSNGSVPITHDCICAQNELSLDGSRGFISPSNVNLYFYMYQSDGSTVGGEGKNIKYSFTYSTDKLANSISTIATESGYVNSTNSNYIFTHESDEIYAYGLQLKNTKGQESYIKWIGDIRFPEISSSNPFISAGSTLSAKNCKIVFTINNLPADCESYRIVRCERKNTDRTLVCQGLISATRLYLGATNFQCATPHITTLRQMKNPTPAVTYAGDHIDLDNTIVQLYSPDISFGNNIDYMSGDRLDLVCILPISYNYYANDADSGQIFGENKNYYPGLSNNSLNIKIIGGSIEYTSSHTSKSINDCKIVEVDPSTGTTSISPNAVSLDGGSQFENYCRPFGLDNIQGKSGRCLIMKLSSALTLAGLNADTTYTFGNRLLLCNYRRNITPYGGNTYSSRFTREYIAVSDFTPKSTSSITVEGDSFISYFELQRTMTVLDGETYNNPEENLIEVIKFPVQTSINTRWRTAKTFCQYCPGTPGTMTNNNTINIQETSGVHANGSIILNQENGLYEYNSVYSRQNDIQKLIPKPLDISENKTFDCRVTASDKKINGEESDSWTKFRTNNFIDVDSSYGSINNIVNYNNELYFWQDKGFGVLSVNQRSLLQDNNPGSLIVGTGGILDRFDYISTTCGNISKYGIIKSIRGLYWLDTINGVLNKFSGELEPISKTKGLQSYLNNLVTSSTTCIGAYDSLYNDVLFTLTGDSQTIVYNELTDSFSPFQTNVPIRYFQTFDNTVSVTNNNTTIYLTNKGNKSTFFNTIYPSSITFVVNDNYDYTKVFDSIQYKSKSYNDDVLLYNDTFNTVKIYNDKQYSGEVSIVTDSSSSNWNTVKREGNFNTVLPRNIVNSNIESDIDIFSSSNHNTSRLYKERIRDKYAIIELTYNNTNGYKFSIPYIKTNYRISYR